MPWKLAGVIPLLVLLTGLIAVMAAPVVAQTGASAPMKVAVIDVPRILTESTRGKETVAFLEQLASEKQAQLKARQDDINELQNRYNEASLSLAEDKLAEMQKQLEDGTIALRRARDDAQRELQTRQKEEFQKIERAVLPVINGVGTEYGYTLIFNKFQSGLVFADEAVDITNLVIERFNATTAQDE